MMKQLPILPIHLIIWLSLTILIIPGLPQSSELPSDDRTLLQLNLAMQFITADGTEAEIQAGIYRISTKSPDILQLTSPSTRTVRNLRALPFTHTESLTAPYPFLIAETDSQSQLHLVLLLPNGHGLDAVGQRRSVQTRGIGDLTKPHFTTKRRYSGIIMQQGRVTTDADWNEQDAMPPAETSDTQSTVTHSYGEVTMKQGHLTLDSDARQSLRKRCRFCLKN